MRRPTFAALVATLAAATLAGCGVPADPSARAITPPPGPYQPVVSAAPTAAAPGAVSEKLYLVKGDKLVAVSRQVRVQPSVEAQVRDLLAGPTPSEQDQGLTSALAGANVISGIHLASGAALVEIGPGMAGAGRNDEVMAFAQVVCTLASRRDVNGVAFTQDGHRIGIPRADGSLTQGTLAVSDYASLIAGG